MRLSQEKPSFAKRAGIAASAALIGAGIIYGAYKTGTIKAAGKLIYIETEAEAPAPIAPKKTKRTITIPDVSIDEVNYDWGSKKLRVAVNALDKDGVVTLRGTLSNGRVVFVHPTDKKKNVEYNEQTKIDLEPGKYNLKIRATDSQSDSGYATKEFEVVKKGWFGF